MRFRAWSIWLYRLCRKKNTICQSDRFAWTYSGRPSTVFHPSSRKTVEVCGQLTFQNGSHEKHGNDTQRLCCNIIRNLNLVNIIRTYTEHYYYAQTKQTQMKHSMRSKIRILIENTPRSVTMPDGMTRRDRYVCSVWAHNRFLADGPKCYCKWGRQIHTSHRG